MRPPQRGADPFVCQVQVVGADHVGGPGDVQLLAQLIAHRCEHEPAVGSGVAVQYVHERRAQVGATAESEITSESDDGFYVARISPFTLISVRSA
jgi:hypothetical protein